MTVIEEGRLANASLRMSLPNLNFGFLLPFFARISLKPFEIGHSWFPAGWTRSWKSDRDLSRIPAFDYLGNQKKRAHLDPSQNWGGRVVQGSKSNAARDTFLLKRVRLATDLDLRAQVIVGHAFAILMTPHAIYKVKISTLWQDSG